MSDTGFDRQGITAGTELILSLPPPLRPASLFTPTPEAARRVLEFFTAQINNPHTRRAYLSAARRFAAWCDTRGIAQLTDVQAFHVAAFITAAGRTGRLTGNALWQQDAYRMIQRRAKAAGIQTRIGNHTFRATGITAYLKNSGTLETAQHIANHESPRTTKLYDRREEEISLDEVERIAI